MNRRMKRAAIAWLCACCALLVGCKDPYEGRLLNMDDSEARDNPNRYARMTLYTISYLDYDVYGTYVLPAEKNSLPYAVSAPSIQPSIISNRWGGAADGNAFYWDKTWVTPKQFKVWWFRVVDPVLFKENNQYDEYTTKETQPGAAWCEAIVTLDKPPPADPRHFILSFYPDGHVEPYISREKELEAGGMRYTFATRDKLLVLQGKPCLKEIPNPFYGMKKPIPQN